MPSGSLGSAGTSIPYARYTIFVCLANIELAVAKKDFDQALALSQALPDEVAPLTRVDIPEVLRFRRLLKCYGMQAYGRYRYNMARPGDEWFAGVLATTENLDKVAYERAPRREVDRVP